jgi:hypothetical protein
MNTIDSKSKPALGFLTVIRHPQHGLFGGYLILNTAGRPLEFHCTAPIKPNRAQEILYGPTLESFLYGEQIGQALIGQGGATPLLVCTDKEPALAAREYISTPLVLVLPSEAQHSESASTSAEAGRLLRLDAAHGGGPQLATFQFGRNRLALPDGADEDRRLVAERLSALAESFDLAEPFERIRAAIEEAQQAAR